MTIPHTSSERTIWWYVIRTLKTSVSWPNNSTLENSRKMWSKKYGLKKYVKVNVKLLVIQSYLILWNHMDCSPPGSSVHGILQARIREWGAIPFSKRSSWARHWTQVSHTAARVSTVQATRFWKCQSLGPIILLYRIQRKYKIQKCGLAKLNNDL